MKDPKNSIKFLIFLIFFDSVGSFIPCSPLQEPKYPAKIHYFCIFKGIWLGEQEEFACPKTPQKSLKITILGIS